MNKSTPNKKVKQNQSTEDNKFIFDSNKPYEFTLAPSDKYQGFTVKQSIHRFKAFRKIMYGRIKQYIEPYCIYWIIPEVSHKQYANNQDYPRLHLHGTIKFKSDISMIEFLINGFPFISQIGRLQFNDYRPDVWPAYINKDKNIMEQYCVYKNMEYEYTNTTSHQSVIQYSYDHLTPNNFIQTNPIHISVNSDDLEEC